MCKCFFGQSFAGFHIGIAMLLQHCNQAAVTCRVGNNNNVTEVFGCRPYHCRAADINVFNGFGFGYAGFGNGFPERVKVYNNKVNRFNAVFFHGFYMFRVAAYSKNAAMNFRVQGFYPAVHNFRKTGYVTNISYRNTCVLQSLHGTAGRNNFHADIMQKLRQFNNAGFVGYA